MNAKPFFSIIVPVYQSKEFLRQTVETLQKQTFSNIEIVLVDDGSTDGSAILCDQLANEDHRIVVDHKKNGGVFSARNRGIEICQGKWIIFVDSDDLVSLTMCENFYNYIRSNYSLDFIACNFSSSIKNLMRQPSSNHVVLRLKDKQQNIRLINQMLLSEYDIFPKKFQKSFGNNVILNSLCAKVYKKSFFINNKLILQTNVMYSEDLLFNIEILAHGAKGIFVDDPIYFYRYNLNSVTHRDYIPHIIENYTEFSEILRQLFRKNNISNLYRSVEIYTFKAVLSIIPADIFQKNNSFLTSYKRFYEIISSPDFLEICNLEKLKVLNKDLDNKTKIKANLLLKKHFVALFFLNYFYKLLKEGEKALISRF